ncbi:hypothetical protein KY361_04505 [Candidatus Woesearchaeota archaeon]|nr:hypothetical protein [Candidatus Woesearchaeota archaeon]
MKMKKTPTIIALSLPLVIAVVWLIFILAANKTFTLAGGAQLAPVRDMEPLIIGLSVFIVGYVLFIVMMFYDDIKEMFWKKKPMAKKPKK